jgi:hypothetical protein
LLSVFGSTYDPPSLIFPHLNQEKFLKELKMSRIKLGAIQILSVPIPENESINEFNPKEVNIEKNTPWQKSKTPSDTFTEVETPSKENRSIFYNGHAGLGSNE